MRQVLHSALVLTIVLGLLVAVVSCGTAPSETDYTGSDITGQDWNQMTVSQKTDWVDDALTTMVLEGELDPSEQLPTPDYVQKLDELLSNADAADRLVASELAAIASPAPESTPARPTEAAPAPSLMVTPGSGKAGSSVWVISGGWTPDTSVNVTFSGANWGTAASDAKGEIQALWEIPQDATEGVKAVAAIDAQGRSCSTTFNVWAMPAPPPASTPSQLPPTPTPTPTPSSTPTSYVLRADDFTGKVGDGASLTNSSPITVVVYQCYIDWLACTDYYEVSGEPSVCHETSEKSHTWDESTVLDPGETFSKYPGQVMTIYACRFGIRDSEGNTLMLTYQ